MGDKMCQCGHYEYDHGADGSCEVMASQQPAADRTPRYRGREDEANGYEVEMSAGYLMAAFAINPTVAVAGFHVAGIPARISDERLGAVFIVVNLAAAELAEALIRDRERRAFDRGTSREEGLGWLAVRRWLTDATGHTWRDVMGLYADRYDPVTGKRRDPWTISVFFVQGPELRRRFFGILSGIDGL
jgi:hypothetical protein